MKVGLPALNPCGGSYSSPQTVTLSTVTPGAVLRYTVDGGEPSEASPVVASGSSVAVPASSTLNVRGYRAGWTTSDLASAAYSLSLGSVAGRA